MDDTQIYLAPLLIEMLPDFDGLILIMAHVMFSPSFPSNRLVLSWSGFSCRIGVNWTPDFCLSPPTTYFEAPIIISITMVNASGEITQHRSAASHDFFETLPYGGKIWYGEAKF